MSKDFLQMHFEVLSDGTVKSKEGYQKQELNIKELLGKAYKHAHHLCYNLLIQRVNALCTSSSEIHYV